MSSSEEFYDRFARTYATYAQSRHAYVTSVDTIIKNESGSCLTMIDVGSGDGKRAVRIAQSVDIPNIMLIDSSSEMLNLMKAIPYATSIKGDISYINSISEKGDLVTCLWNVLGHIKGNDNLRKALKNIKELIADNGVAFIDVNNRYNVSHYGLYSVIRNIFADTFGLSRSDFDLKINTSDGCLETKVHLFSPREIECLLKESGFFIEKTFIVDYRNGRLRNRLWQGQLLFKLRKI